MVSEYLMEPLDDPEHGRIDEDTLLLHNLQQDSNLPRNQPESRTCKRRFLGFLAVIWIRYCIFITFGSRC